MTVAAGIGAVADEQANHWQAAGSLHCGLTARRVGANVGVMNESLGLTSHNSSCNCTGCGMLRAGVGINCAENAAALILESGPGDIAVEPCSGTCREALQLYFSTPPERWRGQRAF